MYDGKSESMVNVLKFQTLQSVVFSLNSAFNADVSHNAEWNDK